MGQGKLFNLDCKNAKLEDGEKSRKLADGNGLYLQVTPKGKYWRFNYRFLDKQKTYSYGKYPEISLAEVREKHREIRRLLREDIDPMSHKKQKRNELRTKHENTFESTARDWHEKNKHSKTEKYAKTVISRLEKNIFPVIGYLPVADVTTQDVLAALRKVEKEGSNSLAHRLNQYCGQIFRYAIACGLKNDNPATNMKDALAPVKTKHYAHLAEHELPTFLNRLDRYETEFNGSLIVKYAFKLLILTALRSKEFRGARWDEINFDKAVWIVPAERMKNKQDHMIPLCKQALRLLLELKNITGDNELCFPSRQNPFSPISENTFLRAIDVLGYKGKTTGHGFRSTFSTILNEMGCHVDAIECQLDHRERNKVRAAYNKAKYIEQRTDLMQIWGDYIEKANPANQEPKIVPLRKVGGK